MRDFNDNKVEVVLVNGRRAFVSRENTTSIFFDFYAIIYCVIAMILYAFLPVSYELHGFLGIPVRLADALLTGSSILAVVYIVCVVLNVIMVRYRIKRRFYFTIALVAVTMLISYIRYLLIYKYFGITGNFTASAAIRASYCVLLELIFAYFVIDKIKGWSEETDRSFVLGMQSALSAPAQPNPAVSPREFVVALDTQQKVRFGNAVFLAREVLMIEAQQHYIDVTTPTKVHRLRFRLKDAIALMPDRLGWLANRSTWVAYDLISEVKPISDGRASLTLLSGEMVVVPRGRQNDLTRLNAILEQRDAVQKSSNA